MRNKKSGQRGTADLSIQCLIRALGSHGNFDFLAVRFGQPLGVLGLTSMEATLEAIPRDQECFCFRNTSNLGNIWVLQGPKTRVMGEAE